MRKSCLTLLLAALLLTACVSDPPMAPPEPARVWPGAPEAPRVTFVQTIVRAEDLGIHRSFLQRLGDLLFGAEDLSIVRPMAVVESAGVVYVADPGIRGVHRFDTAAGSHQVLRAEDDKPLPSPVGLALGSAGEVFVTDSVLHKVFVIAPGAKAAVALQLRAELRQPTGIAVDASSGRMYVVDTAAHHILVFERDGSLAATIGQRGDADGQFNFPTLLWRDAAGRLYVTDALNFRLQVFDERGHFVTKFGRHGDGSGDLARPKGVATDSHGHIYVVDGLLHALQIFDASGRLLLGVGSQGHGRGEFWLPAGIFINAINTIYVADAYNRRVQVFRYVGGAV